MHNYYKKLEITKFPVPLHRTLGYSPTYRMRKLEAVAGVGVCLSDLHADRLDRLRLEVRTLCSYDKKAIRKVMERGIKYSLDFSANLSTVSMAGSA